MPVLVSLLDAALSVPAINSVVTVFLSMFCLEDGENIQDGSSTY